MKNKPTFIAIVCLLIIIIPLMIYGVFVRFKTSESVVVSLTYAKSTFSETDLLVNTYQKGIKETIDPFKVGNKDYAFIDDNNKIYLYSASDQVKVVDYEAVNTYKTTIAGNYALVKREGKWGIIDLDTLKLVVPCEYDYLGLVNNVEDDVLLSNAVIVGENNSYSIYSLVDEFKKISNNYSKVIYDFNVSQLLLALKLDKGYGIYDFEGNSFFSNYKIQDVRITDNYITFIDDTNFLYVFNGLFTEPKTMYIAEEWQSFDVVEKNKSLEIYLDNSLYKKIDI